MEWNRERTPSPLDAALAAIIANALLAGVLLGSGGGIADAPLGLPAWYQGDDGVQFGVGTPRESRSQYSPYVLKITEPTMENPTLATDGQSIRVRFTFSKGTEPVNGELADIAVTWLTLGDRPCLVTKDSSEGFAKDVSRLPEPIYDAGAATVHGRAYLVGGANETGGEPLSTIIEYDPIANTTKIVHRLSTGIERAGVVAYDDEIYVLGGVDDDGVRSTVLVYDPVENTTMNVGNLPAPRHWGAAAVAGEKIYYGGGIDDRGQWSDEIFRFDPTTGESVGVSNLPMPTAMLAATTTYGKVYFIGGNIWRGPGEGGHSNAIVEYDPVANTSMVVATFPPPSGSDGLEALTAVTLHGKVYILNGWDETATPKTRNEVYEFDPATGEDARLAGFLPHRVERGASIGLYGRAFLFGGNVADSWPYSQIKEITEFTPPNATARFNFTLQQWQATCSLPRGVQGLLDLFMRVRYIDHATGQSFIFSDEEYSAVLVGPREGGPPSGVCKEPPSSPWTDENRPDSHGVATWLSRRNAPEAAPPPYCLDV